MKTLVKITALLCALLLTLTLFAACTKGGKTSQPEKESTPDEQSTSLPSSSGVPSENDPQPAPPSHGELSVGGQGSLPAFEW